MVAREKSVYLFLGQDIIDSSGASLKDKALAQLKSSLPRLTRDFNIDTLYASDRDFTLGTLQEKLLFLPQAGSHRIVVVKAVERAKKEVRDFLAAFVQKPCAGILLVLDAETPKPKDEWFRMIACHAQVVHFKEEKRADTFALGRMIDARKAQGSLELLHALLDEGEKPERIMGGLRSSWLRYCPDQAAVRKRIKVLLQTDLEIKTGRIKPVFALERMVVRLCGLRDFSG
jgi:DNA polymerase III delta subunit